MKGEGNDWDFDVWVESFLDFHVDSIADRIHNSPEAVAWREERARAALAAAAVARARITIDQEYGVMPAGLCWVCAAERVETTTRIEDAATAHGVPASAGAAGQIFPAGA